MALSTPQILTLLSLKGIGNKKVEVLFRISEEQRLSFYSSDELLDFLNYCIVNKLLPRVNTPFEPNDFDRAFKSAEYTINRSLDLGITTISVADSCFPIRLKKIVDSKGKSISPMVLYVKGSIESLNAPHAVAIIGTREPSSNGINTGLFFSKKFAQAGFNIVSGLALGCDTTAHKGALSVNGITTAFIASGLDQPIYPKENSSLADEILSNGGAIVSEYKIGEPILPQRFVERDRLQSGLACATIAIQTGIKGGTLHAVNSTLDNGKPLYMVEYKGTELNLDKVQGNIQFLNSGKALPLRSDNVDVIIDKLLCNSNSFSSIKQPSLFD